MTSKRKAKRPITFDSLHIEVLGPRELNRDRVANGYVRDFLRTIQHETRQLLRECAKISPELKGFRLRFR